MNEDLKPQLRSLVDAWVEETQPAPAELDAGYEDVSRRVAAGETSGLATGSSVSPWGFAAGVAGLAVIVVALAWPRAAPEPVAQAVPAAVTVPATPPPPVEPNPAPVITAPADEELDGTMAEPETDTLQKKSRGRAKPARANEAPDAESLAAELKLLREARSALRSGRHGAALEAVGKHGRTFPESAFAEERAATEVMALCGLGRAADANKRAQRFRKLYPSSTFAGALLDGCAQDTAAP